MSKEKLLLVGAGGFGRMAAEQAALIYNCAFVDDGKAAGEAVCGFPVVGHVADLPRLREVYSLLVVCIGNNALRAQIFDFARALGYRFANIIAPSAYISPHAKIGEGCVLLQNVCVQNGASIGDGALLNAGVEIHCDGVVEDYALIYTNAVVRTGAFVGRCARVGSNASIGNHAVVHDNADIFDCTAVQEMQ